jgi:hypothetical protein
MVLWNDDLTADPREPAATSPDPQVELIPRAVLTDQARSWADTVEALHNRIQRLETGYRWLAAHADQLSPAAEQIVREAIKR